MSSFNAYELLPSLLSTLKKEGFTTPTEIQEGTLAGMLRGESYVGIAETGSGKTLAYALPVLDRLKRMEDAGDYVIEPGLPRAIVVVPASELGEQVTRVFKTFTHETRLRVRSVLGNAPMTQARRNVSGPFEILIATPGRLEQLMDRDVLHTSDVRILVFDEADEILGRGFMSTVKRLGRNTPHDGQIAVFSATTSDEIRATMKTLFDDATWVETKGRHRIVPTLKTVHREVPDGQRFPILQEVLAEENDGGTLVFTNTREQCDELAEQLFDHGYPAAMYRGDMDKKERRSNLRRFREGKVKLLICTDLASRGLDVEHVARVINYHMPKEMKLYLHRAGRTARAGRKGTVVNLVTKRDKLLLDRLDR